MTRLLDLLDRLPDWAFALAIILPTMSLPVTFCVVISAVIR